MTFDQILPSIRKHLRVRRNSWPPDQWIKLTRGPSIHTDALGLSGALESIASEASVGMIHLTDHIDKKTHSHTLLIGWLPTLEDLLAIDWELVA